MRAAVAQLSELWFREDISAGEKKDLLLRGRAGLSGKPEQGDRRPCGLAWGHGQRTGGAQISVERPHLYHHIRNLAQTQTDAEIAAHLNQQGLCKRSSTDSGLRLGG